MDKLKIKDNKEYIEETIIVEKDKEQYEHELKIKETEFIVLEQELALMTEQKDKLAVEKQAIKDKLKLFKE